MSKFKKIPYNYKFSRQNILANIKNAIPAECLDNDEKVKDKIDIIAATDWENIIGNLKLIAGFLEMKKEHLYYFKRICNIEDLSFKDNFLLKIAAYRCNYSFIEFLIENGVDVTTCDNEAICLAADPDLINHGDRYNGKPHIKTLELLLLHGADVRARSDYPICAAARVGDEDIVKFLIEKGADVHAFDDFIMKCSDQFTAQLLDFIIKNGGNIHIENDTPLQICTMQFNHAKIKMLLEAGANINAIDCRHLVQLIGWNQSNVLKLLIDNNINLKIHHYHLIRESTVNGHLGCLKILIEAGLTLDILTTNDLIAAIKTNKNNPTHIEFLINNGVDFSRINGYVTQHPQEGIVDLLLDKGVNLKDLLLAFI